MNNNQSIEEILKQLKTSVSSEQLSNDETESQISTDEYSDEILKRELKNQYFSNDDDNLCECYYGFIKNNALYGCIILGEKIDINSSLGVMKGNIIATLSDNRYREDMLNFLKDIIDE